MAAEHNAVVQPGSLVGGHGIARPAAHIQQLASRQALADIDLALHVDDDFRVAVEVLRLAAQQRAGAVAVVEDFATSDDKAEQLGIAQRIDEDTAVFLGRGHAAGARQAHAHAVAGDTSVNGDLMGRPEGTAALGLAAVAGGSHAAEVDLGVRAQGEGGVFLYPLDHLDRAAVGAGDGLDLTARSELAHDADAAHGIDDHGGARRIGGPAQRRQATSGSHNDTQAGIVGPRSACGFHPNVTSGGDGGVDQHLLASADGHAGPILGPDQALAAAVDTARHHPAVDLGVVAGLQHNVAATGVHLRGRVHVQAGGLGRGQQRTVGTNAGAQRDAARNGGLTLPVDEAVGADGEVGTRPHEVEGAAHDGRVLHVDPQVGVRLQRGQRAGHEEAKATLAGQRMGLAQLQRFDNTVVVAVVGVDHKEALGVGHVGDEPAVGLDRVSRPPGHVGIAVVTALALDKGLAQRVQTGTGLVVDGAGVGLKACGGQDAGLLGGRHGVEIGASHGHIHVAPADVFVGVVLAQHKAQAIGLSLCVKEQRAIPAAVAGVGQQHVLLLGGELVKRQAVDRWLHIAPGQRQGGIGGVESWQHAHHLLRTFQRGVDEHRMRNPRITQVLQHLVLLGGAQALERRVGLGRGHTAPVNGRQAVLGAAKTTHHPQQRIGCGIDPLLTRMVVVAQGSGHQLTLLVAEVGKGGVGRRRIHRAPMDLVVAVIGDKALGEALHHLLAGSGVVVEEVLDRWHLHQHKLGRIGLTLGQGAGLHGLYVVDEVGDDQALRRIELRPAGVHVRTGNVVLGVVVAAVPQVAWHGVVVKHIAQVLGHHQLLGAAELGKRGVGRRRGHPSCSPVDAAVVVVGGQALQQPGAHLHRAVERGAQQHAIGIAGVALLRQRQRSLGQGVHKHTRLRVEEAGRRAAGLSLVVERRGVHRIAQSLGHQGLLGVAQAGKRREVGQRLHHQRVHIGHPQCGARDQGLERTSELAEIQCAERGLHLGTVA